MARFDFLVLRFATVLIHNFDQRRNQKSVLHTAILFSKNGGDYKRKDKV